MYMSIFPFSLLCYTMILPVIYVGGRAVKRVSKNNFEVNNASKQYKRALKCLII